MSNMNYLTPHVIATRFIEEGNLTLKEQAALLGISRSSLYYQPVLVDPETLDVMRRIDRIHTDWPEYGARKIARQILKDLLRECEEARKQGLPRPFIYDIGRKRVGRLMEEMGIEAVYQKPHLSLNTVAHPIFPYLLRGLPIVRPNQVWGADITYIRMKGSYCYLVAFLDWYSRFVVGWRLSTTLETQFVLEAAKETMSTYDNPEIMNVDQGVQFTDLDFIGLWSSERTKISMDHKGRCFDNIFTERFWRTLKYGEVYLKDYQSVWEAERNIGDYIQRYNYERLHESLDYKTPAEVYFNKTLLQDSENRIVVPELVS